MRDSTNSAIGMDGVSSDMHREGPNIHTEVPHMPSTLGEGAANNPITICLSEPSGGIHKYNRQQKLYQCLHEFLAKSTWTAVDSNTTTGGGTWVELFMMFDMSKWRDKEAQYHLDIGTQT